MKKTGILLILPASAVLLIYAQTLEFDFVNWDDNLYVTENRGVSSPEEAGIRELMLTSYLGYPVPLTILSYRLDYLFNGLDPFYFHLANLIIFIAIVYLLMSLMISTGSGFVPSLLASLLFAAHPLAVEPVAWVSGRKDLLSLLFALASLAFFFKAAGFLKTERNRRKSGLFLILSGVSFALSLVSKPVFVLLPLIFAVKTDEFVPAGRTKGVLALILSCLVFAAGVITAGMIFQKDVGALSDPTALEWAFRFFQGLFHHTVSAIFPFALSPKYIPESPLSTASPEVIAGAAMFVVFSAALYRLKESKSFIPVLFAALSYLPVSGIIPLNRHLSDSYMFAPLCGLCWAVSGIFDGNASRLKEKTAALKVSVFSLLAASLFVLSAASFHQCGIWRDSVSLWSYVMGKYPDSPQVCRNYGNAFMFSRRFEPGKAAAVYEKCVSALGNRDFFLKNLAIALFHSGRKAEAAALFEEYSMSHPGDKSVLKYMK